MATGKSDIRIKKANVGKFTDYCKSKGYNSVTDECIEEGLASNSAKVTKRAQFAKSAKSWNKGSK